MALGVSAFLFCAIYFIEWLAGYFKGTPIDTRFRMTLAPGGLICLVGLWDLAKGIICSMVPSASELAPKTLGTGLGAFFGGLITWLTFIKIFV